MIPFEATLKTINRARRDGVIGPYAIGGAIGVMFYTQAFKTEDVDVFVHLPVTAAGILTLSHLYTYFLGVGARAEGLYLWIEGVPVQFIPPGSALEEEALKTARTAKYGQTKTRVFRPEYLLAIALKVARRKDLAKVEKLLDEARMDRRRLMDVLRRHKLMKKWRVYLSGA